MRILIIAMGRSGGYQLNQWLALELNYKMIHEPINNKLNINGDNIVVKCLLNEIKNEKNFDFKNWDKIIGLIRTDVRECAISHTSATERNVWRSGYEITNEWILNNIETINKNQRWIESGNNYIINIKEIGLMVTYEEIYDTKDDIDRIKKYIGLVDSKYEHLLDNNNRLRNRNKLKRKLI
jgi:hypothetical protein